jgi:hypothetical protein
MANNRQPTISPYFNSHVNKDGKLTFLGPYYKHSRTHDYEASPARARQVEPNLDLKVEQLKQRIKRQVRKYNVAFRTRGRAT